MQRDSLYIFNQHLQAGKPNHMNRNSVYHPKTSFVYPSQLFPPRVQTTTICLLLLKINMPDAEL